MPRTEKRYERERENQGNREARNGKEMKKGSTERPEEKKGRQRPQRQQAEEGDGEGGVEGRHQRKGGTRESEPLADDSRTAEGYKKS